LDIVPGFLQLLDDEGLELLGLLAPSFELDEERSSAWDAK
jgi:hypothetical protein